MEINQAVIERLNNAIFLAARVAGPGTEAWRLSADWSEWWDDSLLRSMGFIGVPFIHGTVEGFWARYGRVYAAFSPAERRNLPEPKTLKPTASALLTDAGRQTIEANEAAAAEVRNAARKAAEAGAALTQDALEVLERGSEYIERKAFAISWGIVLPIVLGVIVLRSLTK